MKQLFQRATLIGALALFAVGWTVLMSLGVGPTTTYSAAPATAGTTDADPAAAASAAFAPGPSGPQIQYIDDTAFPEITVYLTVHDEAGQPLLGLSQNQFTLLEDDEPVEITRFTGAGKQAATVILVIDRSGSMDSEGKMAGAQRAAGTFVAQLEPTDRAGLIAFDNSVDVLAPLTPVTPESQRAMQQAIGALRPRGGTEFYAAVQQAIAMLANESGRKVVLGLSDGLDNAWGAGISDTIDMAIENSTPVYVIGLGSDVNSEELQRLASETGGDYYFAPSADELTALYQQIGAGLRNEYALTYNSNVPQLDGTRRNLDVSISRAGGTLTAEGDYAVGGILAPSLNLAHFIPLFAVLACLLALLYVAPRRLVRTRSDNDPALPDSPPVPVAPAPTPVMNIQRPPLAVSPNRSPAAVSLSSPVPAIQPPAELHPAPSGPMGAIPGGTTTGTAMGAKPGGTIVVQYPLSGSETIIGSAPTAHLSIPGSTLAPHHARITWVNDRFAIEDMSNGQTWVSFRGDPTQLRQVPINALRNGSLIRLGEERFIFRQPEGANAYLERQMTLPAHGLTIGSAAVCDIIVNGGAAQQARIIRDGQRWVVESLSTGGAYVSFSGDPAQERPVSGRNALKPGSLLRVANTTLRMAE